MKKAWKPYGVDVKIKAHSINKIIEWGTTEMSIQDQLDKLASDYNKTKDPNIKNFGIKR